MKIARIVPLYKSGDKTAPGYHLPISLTLIIAKIFESLIYDSLVSHVKINNIVISLQHEFLKIKSTNTKMLSFWEEVSNLANEVKYVSFIYTVIRKAFDSVHP